MTAIICGGSPTRESTCHRTISSTVFYAFYRSMRHMMKRDTPVFHSTFSRIPTTNIMSVVERSGRNPHCLSVNGYFVSHSDTNVRSQGNTLLTYRATQLFSSGCCHLDIRETICVLVAQTSPASALSPVSLATDWCLVFSLDLVAQEVITLWRNKIVEGSNPTLNNMICPLLREIPGHQSVAREIGDNVKTGLVWAHTAHLFRPFVQIVTSPATQPRD